MELKIYEFDDLICTDIEISNQGKSLIIKNVVIDWRN